MMSLVATPEPTSCPCTLHDTLLDPPQERVSAYSGLSNNWAYASPSHLSRFSQQPTQHQNDMSRSYDRGLYTDVTSLYHLTKYLLQPLPFSHLMAIYSKYAPDASALDPRLMSCRSNMPKKQ